MKTIIGSRGSDLALAQVRYIRGRLAELENPPETDLIIIKTSGDVIQNVSLSSIGDTTQERKGFFTKEIEEALLAKEIDFAVHSFKDLPTEDPAGLAVVSIPQRVEPQDVLVIPKGKRTREEAPFLEAGSVIGTASVRRVSQLNFLWPDIKCTPIRGNVPTRVEKLKRGRAGKLDGSQGEGEIIDAIMLARAGLDRLKAIGLFDEGGEYAGLLDDFDIIPLPEDTFIPAPAQGALALQCRADDKETIALLQKLHDGPAAQCVEVERDILEFLEGGCHLPLGCFCDAKEGGGFSVRVFLGQEAVNNRFGRSYNFSREGSDSKELARRVIQEIKEPLPVVLTGRKTRVNELLAANPDKNGMLIGMPLIDTEVRPPEADEAALFQEWFDVAAKDPDAALLGAFSRPAVDAFRDFLADQKLTLPSVRWAVTGDKTSEAVLNAFPGAKIAFTSPDGTGKSLAVTLLAQGVKGQVLALSAEYGRPEFKQILTDAGLKVERFKIYRNVKTEPTAEEVQNLPADCLILFGSPSAVEVFFQGYNKVYQSDSPKSNIEGHRFCALGPTTRDALLQSGHGVYAVSKTTDYEAFIQECGV